MNETVDCVIRDETHKALKVDQPSVRGSETVWVPKSECSQTIRGARRHDGAQDATIVIPQWLAEKKGLLARP